ncbi:NAD(P)H-dependent flavin oxidoreductase [Chloroflexota bacterium]
MFKTRLTELLGIKYPVVGGAMGRLTTGEFVAAISNAGCLGLIAAATMDTKEELREHVRICRKLTDRPFGVSTALIARDPAKLNGDIDVCIEEGVKVLETTAQSPAAYADKIKKSDMIWLHKCATVRHAQSAESLGIDAVTIVGFEAAGHTGLDDLPLSIVIPWAKDTLKIPVLASGGVADGRALAALIALGADGVQIGTRFMLTEECPGHPKFKEWLLNSRYNDTCYVERSVRRAFRVRRNKAAEEVLEMEKKGATPEDMYPLMAGERNRRLIYEGDIEAGLLACGPVVGSINDILPVKEVVERVISQAEEIVNRLHSS